MDVKAELGKLKPLIDKEMEKIIPREITQEWMNLALGKAQYAYDVKTLTDEVSKPIWDFLDRGGKRWRPGLLVWCCEAVGGTQEQGLQFAAVPELVHTGTLWADDIEDDADTRRGKPAAHVLFGIDTAINDSNALYFLPLIIAYRNLHNLTEKQRLEIYDVYSEEMLRVSLGQAMDIHWHKGKTRDLKEGHYLQMCLCKTGVLARMSAKIGGIVGNGSKEQIQALGKFAESVGVGFQIQDDILNLVPESEKWGKRRGEDISEGKRTLMVLYALKKLTEAEQKELLGILNEHTKDIVKINRAIELIQGTGAMDYAKRKAEEIVLESWKGIKQHLPDSTAKEKLKALAEYVVQRKI